MDCADHSFDSFRYPDCTGRNELYGILGPKQAD